jgi:hypothetical protein
MLPYKVASIFSLGMVLALWGCTPSTADRDQSAAESATADAEQAGQGVAPGRYCYGIEADTQEGVLRLTVAADQSITGDSSVTIQAPEEGYYSSYAQKLSGQLQGNQAAVDITTWIEYDVQESQEVWTITPETVQAERSAFNAIDCAVAQERFAGPDGLEAADLLEGATVREQRVQFDPGTTGATVEDAVVQGERTVYQVRAEGGQQMVLLLVSPEDNAVLDVISPSGLVLARESTREDLILPQTGDYQIVVGGTRGNATYKLRIDIIDLS